MYSIKKQSKISFDLPFIKYDSDIKQEDDITNFYPKQRKLKDKKIKIINKRMI